MASEDRGLKAVRDAIRDLELLGAVEAKNYYNIVLTWWQPPDGCSTPWATITAPDVFRLQVDTSPRPAVVETSMGESRTPVS